MLAVKARRDRVGCFRGLARDQTVEQAVARALGDGPAQTLGQEPVTVDVREQRELRQVRIRFPHERFEQHAVGVDHAPHRRGIEEIGVVGEADLEAVFRRRHLHAQIEVGAPALEIETTDLESRKLQRPCRRVGDGEVDLEQGIPTRVAFRLELFDQPLERHGLMPQRPQCDVTDTFEQFAKRRVARSVGAQDQHVEEAPDQSLELGSPPVDGRRPHRDVILPRDAAKQHDEGRQHGHEERASALSPQLFERAQLTRVHCGALRRAVERLMGGPRAIHRQIERGHAVQRRGPVRE